MKYQEFKSLGKVSGIFSLIAFIITYKTKETLSILTLVLVAWIATLILNPDMAASIKNYITGLLK
jgi:hypothetical protein